MPRKTEVIKCRGVAICWHWVLRHSSRTQLHKSLLYERDECHSVVRSKVILCMINSLHVGYGFPGFKRNNKNITRWPQQHLTVSANCVCCFPGFRRRRLNLYKPDRPSTFCWGLFLSLVLACILKFAFFRACDLTLGILHCPHLIWSVWIIW